MDEMGANIDDGIHAAAESQIKMLDGLIQLLETIVAMEGLSDIAGDDMVLELPEIVVKPPEMPSEADFNGDMLAYQKALKAYELELDSFHKQYGDVNIAYTEDY
jgi:hypothetical protein